MSSQTGLDADISDTGVFQGCRGELLDVTRTSQLVETVLDLLNSLLPAVTAHYQKLSPVGSNARAVKALHELATTPKLCEQTDQLMVRSSNHHCLWHSVIGNVWFQLTRL